jgi:hypothetical protein
MAFFMVKVWTTTHVAFFREPKRCERNHFAKWKVSLKEKDPHAFLAAKNTLRFFCQCHDESDAPFSTDTI